MFSLWGYEIPQGDPTNGQDKVVSIKQHDHSPGCKILGQGRLMVDLDILEQDAVLSCPHRSHDAVKVLFRVTSDAPPSRRIEEGKLF